MNATGTGRRIASRRSKRRIAFGWYGGKFSHLDFLAPLIPGDAGHFCDVFGGFAAVLMNVGPFPVETYNDLDSELVNFFETLRDREPELVRAIRLTPFSREELARACEPAAGLSRVERARRFCVRARQPRTGIAQTTARAARRIACSRRGRAWRARCRVGLWLRNDGQPAQGTYRLRAPEGGVAAPVGNRPEQAECPSGIGSRPPHRLMSR